MNVEEVVRAVRNWKTLPVGERAAAYNQVQQALSELVSDLSQTEAPQLVVPTRALPDFPPKEFYRHGC